MGLNVYIYRSGSSDCTAYGISSIKRGVEQLCLVNVDGPFEPTETTPAAMLVPNSRLRIGRPLARIVPAVRDTKGNWVEEPRWTMFGGNFAASSDGRFSDAIESLIGQDFYGAVAIHDRIEM